jgi:hypothetical protein
MLRRDLLFTPSTSWGEREFVLQVLSVSFMHFQKPLNLYLSEKLAFSPPEEINGTLLSSLPARVGSGNGVACQGDLESTLRVPCSTSGIAFFSTERSKAGILVQQVDFGKTDPAQEVQLIGHRSRRVLAVDVVEHLPPVFLAAQGFYGKRGRW